MVKSLSSLDVIKVTLKLKYGSLFVKISYLYDQLLLDIKAGTFTAVGPAVYVLLFSLMTLASRQPALRLTMQIRSGQTRAAAQSVT